MNLLYSQTIAEDRRLEAAGHTYLGATAAPPLASIDFRRKK